MSFGGIFCKNRDKTKELRINQLENYKRMKIKNYIKSVFTLSLTVVMFWMFSLIGCGGPDKIKALVVTGQNNHNWSLSSKNLKTILETTSLFDVEMAVSPEGGGDMTAFHPAFAKYQVVVLDYNGEAWPEETQRDFEKYMKNGGGLVVYHAANNPFPEWKAFNEMIGVGGWGDRDEQDGPYVYWEKDKFVRDTSPGKAGSHGEAHPYKVTIRNQEHPVTKGLPVQWMHAKDELYNHLRGPAQNMDILATAYDDTTYNGSGHDEPVLMAIQYGKGRVFHTILGHAGNDTDVFPAMQCVGFIVTLQRGAEWAATGKVTQTIPADFPNSVSVHKWENFVPMILEELMDRVVVYKVGKSRKYLADLSNRIRMSDGSEATLAEFEKSMIDMLQSDATIDSKKYICKELSWMGSEHSIPILKSLLEDGEMSDMAAYALHRLDPSALK